MFHPVQGSSSLNHKLKAMVRTRHVKLNFGTVQGILSKLYKILSAGINVIKIMLAFMIVFSADLSHAGQPL